MLGDIRKKLRSWLGITELTEVIGKTVDVVGHINNDLDTSEKIQMGVIEHLQKQETAIDAIQKLLSTDVGVDWGYKDDTVVIIMTRVGGGRVKILDLHLGDLNEMRDLSRRLEALYSPRWIEDKPSNSLSQIDWDDLMGRLAKRR